MSFRHTYITEFLYKGTKESERDLESIKNILEKYGTVTWNGNGMKGLGYFHGVIKDLDGYSTNEKEGRELIEELSNLGVRIVIIYE